MGRGKSYTDEHLITNLQEGDTVAMWSERTGVSMGTLRNRIPTLVERNQIEELEPHSSADESSGRPAKRYRRVSAKSPSILREGGAISIKGKRWTYDEHGRILQLGTRSFNEMPTGAQRYLNLAENAPHLFTYLLSMAAGLPYDEFLKTRDNLVLQGEKTVEALEKRIAFIKELIYSPQIVEPFTSGFVPWAHDFIAWLESHDPSFSTPQERIAYLNLLWNQAIDPDLT
jgi:hypothetical protein